ncbi:hypothetical protein DSM107010_57530 [Chroococcidiopsis cubana SAG 39.79]|uniref:Uncharacterized protein n=1 Tax=Chroococcidiopsis cubana SAG 39.79 TaxID=388085 RepID=A0AB37UCA6_9CYAN|nr:hypothetical protein DSM107010_57530 [Chroococcidiopsis cubana SAG 39.79]
MAIARELLSFPPDGATVTIIDTTDAIGIAARAIDFIVLIGMGTIASTILIDMVKDITAATGTDDTTIHAAIPCKLELVFNQ